MHRCCLTTRPSRSCCGPRPTFAEVLNWYERINVAVIPMGSWNPPQSQIYDNLTEPERQELLELGVRVDTSTVLLTEDGTVVTPPLSQRLIGISGDQLARIPEVIAVVGGSEKTAAIRTALRAGFIPTLITNASVARELLNHPWRTG